MTTTEPPVYPPLSRRQCEVVALIADGATDKQIARELNISLCTVKRHGEDIRNLLALPRLSNPRVLLARWWWDHEKSDADTAQSA